MKSYFQTFRLFCSSLRFIQFRACCCGSIHIGNLLALVVKIPFWIDNSSGGRPSDVHLLEKESHPNLIAIRLLQNYTVYIKKNLFLKHLKFSHPIFEKLIFQIKLHNFIKLFISYKHYNFQFLCKDLYTYLLTSTSLVSSSSSLNGSLSGTSLLCKSSTQSVYTISLRNSQLKAPT